MTTDAATVAPCARLRGLLRVPGDKSISHRTAMLSALADGNSTIRGFLRSEDCLHTLSALEAMGVGVSRDSDAIRIGGLSGRFRAPEGALDLGNSGTGMRLLAGLLAGQPFTSEMTGDASLCSRPMRRIGDPLERLGARVELLGANGCAPVRITGGRLRGIEYALPVASAQVKSCVLLAGLFAEGRTTVIEPKATRDHTEILLRMMGVEVDRDGLSVSVRGGADGFPVVKAGHWRVPGDFSSAAFWITAAAARPGSDVVIDGVGLNPRRTALLDVLHRMGADIQVGGDDAGGARESGDGEALGSVRVRGATLKGTEVGGDDIPNLIDELPLVAVAGALADGVTTIRDAAELRVKESDRIAAMCVGLRELGVDVQETADGMAVRGGARLRGGVRVESRGDHRVAMCMAILATAADAPVEIRDVACVATSYPGFWRDMEALCQLKS